MTEGEQKLKEKLEELSSNRKWIALQLWPSSSGLRTIVSGPINQCRVNEGRDGKFDQISESFYDKMVEEYHHKRYRI